MEKRGFHILGVLLMLTAVSEAGIIPKEDPSGDGEIPLAINKFDKKLFPSGIKAPEDKRDEFGIYEYDMGASDPQGSPDYDYGKPGNDDIVNKVDKHKPGIIKPGKIPQNDENPFKNYGDEGVHEPSNGEEDMDKSIGGDKDSEFPVDEDKDKPNHKDVDEPRRGGDDEKKEPEEEDDAEEEEDDKKVPIDEEVDDDEEEEDDKKVPVDEEVDDDDDDNDKKVPEDERKDDDDEDEKAPEDEGDDDDDNKVSEDDDDKKVPKGKHIPVDDEEKPDENDEPKEESDEDHVPIDNDEKPIEDDEKIGGGEESEFSNRGSIFDTPIFNLNQVQKYFHQLERALGHVFRQTMDEAALLNGTYANTTEEEVEIDGKKYVIQKSIIKGADNDSSIYIEALSSKSKTNDTQEVKGIDVQNATHV